jgi:membrane protein implicated in regulation of membrane protease activity
MLTTTSLLNWAMVTGILVAVLSGAVLGLQALLAGVTQGETLAVAASTLMAAALFQPVRRRVQRTVDRRFDRARYDGELVAAAFAERLRDEVDLASAGRALTDTVTVALRPSGLGLWLRAGAN